MEIPNFLTHYYLAERQPFLTLSELEMGQNDPIFKELQTRHKKDNEYHHFCNKN